MRVRLSARVDGDSPAAVSLLRMKGSNADWGHDELVTTGGRPAARG